jgi:hypothetical protein
MALSKRLELSKGARNMLDPPRQCQRGSLAARGEEPRLRCFSLVLPKKYSGLTARFPQTSSLFDVIEPEITAKKRRPITARNSEQEQQTRYCSDTNVCFTSRHGRLVPTIHVSPGSKGPSRMRGCPDQVRA